MTAQKLTVFLSNWWVIITQTKYSEWFSSFPDAFPNIFTTKEMMLSKRDLPCAGWCHQQLKRGQMCGQTYRLLNFFRLQVYQPMKTSDIKMYEDVDVWLMYDVYICLFSNFLGAPNHCALDTFKWDEFGKHCTAAEYLVTIGGGCLTWESHAVQSNMEMDIRFCYVQEEFKVVYLRRGPEFACIMPKSPPVHFWF